MIVELLLGAHISSLYGHAVGLNMANHLGAFPTTPCICDIPIPTSISRLGVIAGRLMSRYILPLPTGPPNRPLSTRTGCNTNRSDRSGVFGAEAYAALPHKERQTNTMMCNRFFILLFLLFCAIFNLFL